jgi:hypothetical protein
VAEVLVIYRALAANERERLEGYLAHKWGIAAKLPVNHPYKSAVPVYTTPAAIAGLSGSALSQQASLTWSAGDDGGSTITDYIVEYRVSPSGSWTRFNDGVSTATNTTVSGLNAGVAYDFRIGAVNFLGTGSWSNTVTLTPY